MEIWLRYDLRTPPFGAGSRDLYRAALEQVSWADSRGISAAYLGEHHGTDDGYLPSPFALAAAMASRTSTMRMCCLALLPLLDPLRAAEDIAVLDLVSDGRAEVTIGLGYVPDELAMFGVSTGTRASLAEEKIPVLRAALAGETVVYRTGVAGSARCPYNPVGSRSTSAGPYPPRRAGRPGWATASSRPWPRPSSSTSTTAPAPSWAAPPDG